MKEPEADLGDGVYASFSGHYIKLRTRNHGNVIFLTGPTFGALLAFMTEIIRGERVVDFLANAATTTEN